MKQKLILAALSAGLILSLGGCTKTTSATPPTTVAPASPADLVAQANDAVAKSVSQAYLTAANLRAQNQISVADYQNLLVYFKKIALASQNIASIQTASGSWAVEKPQLLAYVPTAVSSFVPSSNPTAAAVAATVSTVWATFTAILNQQAAN